MSLNQLVDSRDVRFILFEMLEIGEAQPLRTFQGF